MLINLIAFALLLQLVIVPFCLTQQTVLGDSSSASNPFDEEFEKLANKSLAMWHVPGLAIAVVDGDDVFAKVRLFHLLLVGIGQAGPIIFESVDLTTKGCVFLGIWHCQIS